MTTCLLSASLQFYAVSFISVSQAACAHNDTLTHTHIHTQRAGLCAECVHVRIACLITRSVKPDSGGGVVLSLSHLQAVDAGRLSNYTGVGFVRSRCDSTAWLPPCLLSDERPALTAHTGLWLINVFTDVCGRQRSIIHRDAGLGSVVTASQNDSEAGQKTIPKQGHDYYLKFCAVV